MVRQLLVECGLPGEAADRVALLGDEQPYATTFAVTECASAAIGASAAAASLIGFTFLQGTTTEISPPASRLDHPLVQLYRCGDGRWVHLHGAFPHLAEAGACGAMVRTKGEWTPAAASDRRTSTSTSKLT